MLTDLQLANLLQDQYDDKPFDYQKRISDVSFSVVETDDEVVILFEGSHNLPDWIDNFRVRMIQVRGLGGVEEGFYTGLSDVLNDLVDNKKLVSSKTIVVTGHSRGAAHANIFAVMLNSAGIYPVRRVTFASPRPGDSVFAGKLAAIPGHTYWNYKDMDEQDFVCSVPLHCQLAPYARPEPCIIIDVPPHADDPWLLFSRHHLTLYIKGLVAV